MIIIVGLGNPGKKYKNTRHNIGFRIVDEFAGKNNFPEFKLSKKFNSLISEGSFDGKKVIIAKPQTFMNESGKAVKGLTSEVKQTTSEVKPDLVVIHDDIDLPIGKIRIVKNRGAAGHKGVESVTKEIGTRDFIRFRIGISPSQILQNKTWVGKPKNAEKFVLQKIKKEEKEIIKEVVNKTVEAIESTLKEGLEKSMSGYNK